MKVGIRKPSLKKMIAARTSVKRIVRHNLGVKVPRGWGGLPIRKKLSIIVYIIVQPLMFFRYSRNCLSEFFL